MSVPRVLELGGSYREMGRAHGAAFRDDIRRYTDERIALAHSYAAGPRVPEGEGTARVESANGEFGFFLVADGGPTPRRVRCRAPSFFHAQALSAMLVGQTLADLGPTLALANIESAECDR